MNRPLEGRVAAVTGGGGGIGSAVAFELARQGAHVLVVDPGVGVEGEPLHEATAAATADRIEAAGGSASHSMVSVTDREELASLFGATRDRYGSLDIVVNPAGILRYPKLPDTSEDDWLAVLGVHFGGYVNVLSAALTPMVDAGYGRIVGFTSGVGLSRTAGDAMSYGAAKRAVAALTWRLGPLLPAGVRVNCLSPIAATRMVRSTLRAEGAGPAGLDLSAMPQPDDMAPAAAYLAGAGAAWLQGRVIFSAGSELSMIAPPRLLEAVRTEGVEHVGNILPTVMPVVLAPAETRQRSGGGSNPRFGDVWSPPSSSAPGGEATRACLVVADPADVGRSLEAALPEWGMTPVAPSAEDSRAGFDAAAQRMLGASDSLHAVIIASRLPARPGRDDRPEWAGLIDAQAASIDSVLFHASWLRAAARYASETGRPLRVAHVMVVDGDAGRPAAQAVAQIARSVADITLPVSVEGFSVSVESAARSDLSAAAHLVARLVSADDSRALRGGELVVGRGWLGLRSHPEPAMSVSFGGPAIPGMVDDALARAATGFAT